MFSSQKNWKFQFFNIHFFVVLGNVANQSPENSFQNTRDVNSTNYISSRNLNGIIELSTLMIETTTPTNYDEFNPKFTTEKFKENGEQTIIHNMRKVLKHIYKRPIHSKSDKNINKQDVLLKTDDSKKDLLTVFKRKLTDVNKSDAFLMNGNSTTTSGNFNDKYKESIQEGNANSNDKFIGMADQKFNEDEKIDSVFTIDHQSEQGTYKNK